ncbi:MAG: hypothetical protein ACJ0F8_04070 [Gammaproteobacteria bacterium]|uniref:Uncharacterized protein n=1 Tax=SAR86 cluster bacterium TaxID=2030880 RepID=A0A520N1M0_9GAMM|nr:hypothetical protein [SAR86 cluster bacterium]RZO27316.1 MAG: hypothetical protein EVA92_00810 [SAR86 cluster bacterium]|tara:strand:- start:11055 stop:11351 length:297 start_codon:yes stop_codon:yes gene_type:complete
MRSREKLTYFLVFVLLALTSIIILSDILYNDYSFEKNQELKEILNEKESELILLNEENLALKEKILMQRESFESSEKEIFQKNEAEQKKDLKNNNDPK